MYNKKNIDFTYHSSQKPSLFPPPSTTDAFQTPKGFVSIQNGKKKIVNLLFDFFH